MARLPYMKLFVNPILADTGELSEAEFGAYMRLLLRMWKQDGRLPNDPEKLRKLAGCAKPSIWDQRWKALARFFEVDDDGFLVNPKLTDERAHALGISAKRSDAGAESAKRRAELRREKETGDPDEGNSYDHKPLKNNDADATGVERRARVQTTERIAESEESSTVVLFPLAQQAALQDDWPEVAHGNLLDELARQIGHPWLDPSKDVTTKLHKSAITYFARWREARCSWQFDILPSVTAQCVSSGPVRSLALFDGAILDAQRRRTAPAPTTFATSGDHRHDDKLARNDANAARSESAGEWLDAFYENPARFGGGAD